MKHISLLLKSRRVVSRRELRGTEYDYSPRGDRRRECVSMPEARCLVFTAIVVFTTDKERKNITNKSP